MELLVGIAIFTVAASVMTGLFVGIVRSERLVQDVISVNNNAGLVLEQIAREARTGYDFQVAQGYGADCSSDGGSQLQFINGQNGTQTAFELAGNGTVTRSENQGDAVEITASNVEVRQLCFRAVKYQGSPTPDCNPERLTIVMEVAPRNAVSSTVPLHLETSVSSRVLPREITGDPYNCRVQIPQ